MTSIPRGLGSNKDALIATARFDVNQDAFDRLKEWQIGQFLLGQVTCSDKIKRYVGYKDDRHIITIAGSRSGKGINFALNNLKLYPHSLLCIDVKAEAANYCALSRAKRGNVAVLDPFGRSDEALAEYCTGYNPMAAISSDETDTDIDRATMIADALIISASGSDSHWTDGARNLLTCLILHVAREYNAHDRHLLSVRELLTTSKEEFNHALKQAASYRETVSGQIARAFLRKTDAEASSIVSTAEIQTTFLTGSGMRHTLCDHGFDLKDLRGEIPLSVFLVLPASRLNTHGRWLRLFVNLALDDIESLGPIHNNDPKRCLFYLDEFASLGTMKPLERAAGQIAGYGITLYTVLQDLGQLKALYKESWETFIGNSGLKIFHGNSDLTTLEYLSKLMGDCEVRRTDISETQQTSKGESDMADIQKAKAFESNNRLASLFSSATISESKNTTTGKNIRTNIHAVPLMRTNEIQEAFSRETGLALIFAGGGAPIIIETTSCLNPKHSTFIEDAVERSLITHYHNEVL